jgi:hypothetical protein
LNFHAHETGGKTTDLCVTMFHMAKRPRDPNQLAKLIVDIATGDAEDSASESMRKPSRHRSAGKAGGAARAKTLTPEERKAIATKAAATRWKNKS